MLRNIPTSVVAGRKGAEGSHHSENQFTSRQPGVWEESVGCVVQMATSQKSQCGPSKDMNKRYAVSSGARQVGAYPPAVGDRQSIQWLKEKCSYPPLPEISF